MQTAKVCSPFHRLVRRHITRNPETGKGLAAGACGFFHGSPVVVSYHAREVGLSDKYPRERRDGRVFVLFVSEPE